jgi:L-iditol 2-dehydrogenase
VTLGLPADMPFEVAAFTEPLACAVRAVDRSQAEPGDRVAVFGGGGMGLLIAQALLARGARPLVLEVSEARLALARTLGLKETLNPLQDDVGRAAMELTGGAGLDGVILTVLTPPVLAQAQQLARPGGRITVFAGPAEAPQLAVDFSALYHRELTIAASYSATPAALREALDLLATGAVRVAPLITHRLPLDAFAEGVRLQRSGEAIKVIFQP